MPFLESSATRLKLSGNHEKIISLLLTTSVGTTGNKGEIYSLKGKYFKYCMHEMHIQILLYLSKSYSYITVNNHYHLENLSYVRGKKKIITVYSVSRS